LYDRGVANKYCSELERRKIILWGGWLGW